MDLLKGTLDAMVLKALTWGPRHGYAVSRWIRGSSGEAFDVDDAALYQALHRLERRGMLESEWGLSENNRRAKYYALTEAGRAELRSESKSIRRYVEALLSVLDATAADS